MDQTIKGKYDEEVIFQVFHPRIADVSSLDYPSATFKNNKGVMELKPFIICHPKSLKMKVQAWDGTDIIWTFEAGKDPTLLSKIYKTPAPLVVENGDPTATTVTSIQVGY